MTTPNTPIRAVIYTRISHDAEGRELGVTRQREDCLARIERAGYKLATEATGSNGGEYRDNDRGASTRSRKPRPAFDAMLAAVRNGEADVIVAYSMSRITRRMSEWLILLDLIRETGVRIETIVSGTADVNTADGRAVLLTIATWDQAEAERTAERIARAHRQRADSGRPNWTRRPFGHNLDGTECEAEAAAIRAAARMIIEERATLYAVAKAWNDADIRTARGARWTIASVGDLLRAPRIAGLLPDGRPGKFAAILTPDRWRSMCAILAERGRAVAVKGGAGRLAANLLSGIAECYRCDGRISAITIRGARRYVCAGGHVQVPADAADAYVARWVAAGRKVGKLGKGGAFAPLRGAETVETAPLYAERDRLNAQIAEAADAIRAGQAVAILAPILADLERQRDAVVERIAAAEAEAERARSLPALLAEWDSMTIDGRREILRDMVARGVIFQLRPFVEGEPDERIMIIDTTDTAADLDHAA